MIEIVLATCNGERWLPAQLHSLARQTHGQWRLWVADDGSRDGTPALLARAASDDPRITLLPASAEAAPLGPAKNFARLLAALQVPPDTPVLLADQDDEWHPEKLERLASRLEHNLLVFSDARLVDERGRAFARLFERLRFAPPVTLERAIADNPAAGCTMGFRAELLDLALPLPNGLENHDWWLLLCALSKGAVTVIADPLVDYRQHGGNAVGAGHGGARRVASRLRRQRRVLLGKPAAAAELVRRLQQRQEPVPAALSAYVRLLGTASPRRQAWLLALGRFATSRWSLRLLQVVALLLPPWERSR